MQTFPDQIELTVALDEPEDLESLRKRVAKQLRIPVGDLPKIELRKRALDARRGKIQFHLVVAIDHEEELNEDLGAPHPRECKGPARTIVVGDGPAGLFCAYQLARRGVPCVVVDRGKQVQPRRRDLKLLNARGGVDENSNYCFGEGGAGTYSDGKLYTRSHKRGPVRDVMEVLALHGAPESILTEARPHIGSNLLPQVIGAIRERLEAVGVQFRFGSCLTGVETEGEGSTRRVTFSRSPQISEQALKRRALPWVYALSIRRS